MIGRIFKVGAIDAAGIAEALELKQDVLTFDQMPTAGSQNPVTSAGIAAALEGKQAALTIDSAPAAGSANPVSSGGTAAALAGKQDKLTFDGTPVAGSTKPITSGAVHAALSQKQDRLYFDNAPIQGSNNILTSGAIYEAVRNAHAELEMDNAPTSGSAKPVSSGGVYIALTNKQDRIWKATLSLSTSWSGSDPYTQTVSITGATTNSMIELHPSLAQIQQFKADGVDAMWVENNNGVLTVYVLGARPTVALSLQCTVTEVGDTPGASGGNAYDIDQELSPSSTNPVQNRAVYNALSGKETVSNRVTEISIYSSDLQYPSAKAVWQLFKSITDGDGVGY